MRATNVEGRRLRRPRRVLVALIVGALAVPLLGACEVGDDADLVRRQAEVAQRGAEVMPFDLDATTHRFEPTATGLVQTVTADDPADRRQVGLIRQHLEEEAVRFADGDFGDPAAIHGHGMPGLAELRAGAGAIDIRLEHLDDGARMTFTTDDPRLVDALHRWGEAQVLDHGVHAEHGSS